MKYPLNCRKTTGEYNCYYHTRYDISNLCFIVFTERELGLRKMLYLKYLNFINTSNQCFLPMAKFLGHCQKKLDFFVRFTRYKYIPYRKKWACTNIFDFFRTKNTASNIGWKWKELFFW